MTAAQVESGAPATYEQIFDALADLLDAGKTFSEALAAVARVGPSGAAFSSLWKPIGGATLPAPARLLRAGLSSQEIEILHLGETAGRLAPSLRLCALHRRDRRALRLAARNAAYAPFMVLLFSALLSPLLDLFTTGAYFHAAIVNVLWLVIPTALVVYAGPRLFHHPRLGPALRETLTRLRFRALLTLHSEAALAAALLIFSESPASPTTPSTTPAGSTGDSIGAGPFTESSPASAGTAGTAATTTLDAAMCLVTSPPLLRALIAERVIAAAAGNRLRSGALLPAAENSSQRVPPASSTRADFLAGAISEPLALILLPADSDRKKSALRAFHDEATAALHGKVRAQLRALGWAVALVISALSVRTLLSHPLPGFGSGLGSDVNLKAIGDTGGVGADEMKELEKLLQEQQN